MSLRSSQSVCQPSRRRFNFTNTDYGMNDAMTVIGDVMPVSTTNNDDADDGMTMMMIDPMIKTTPFHEVARLGHVELLKCMLQHGRHQSRTQIYLDVRNGYGRTVLHNVAGGLAGTDKANRRIMTSIDADTRCVPLAFL